MKIIKKVLEKRWAINTKAWYLGSNLEGTGEGEYKTYLQIEDGAERQCLVGEGSDRVSNFMWLDN